jgi:metallophosphoesterase (TIGR00282 family)
MLSGNRDLIFWLQDLKKIREEKNIDFVVVNGENANMIGITPSQADEIFESGADAITLGNHTWIRWELKPYLDKEQRILRPANFAPQCPGRGYQVFNTDAGKLLLINLMGKFTLDANTDNPFVIVDSILSENEIRMVFVDFHAEATSEKLAMGYHLDGRVSAVWGTHTHVQTSDIRVLQHGTAYITDIGMTGAENGVLGVKKEQSIGKFFGDPPQRFNPADGSAKLEGAIFDIDPETGACLNAEALRIM